MNPQDTIRELKARGYRVNVSHCRLTEDDLYVIGFDSEPPVQVEQIRDLSKPKHRLDPGEAAPFGGRTLVTAERVDGGGRFVWVGEAVCSVRDHFDRHLGLAKATGRLVGELKRAGVEL